MSSSFFTQIGGDIDGEASSDYSGESVSFSSDGSVVAIGAPYNDGNGSASGHVRIYKNVNNIWTQVGSDIDGEDISVLSGTSISLSSDGSVVAIGAPWVHYATDYTGHVRIYKNENDTWTQVGGDINGKGISNIYSGESVSLSSDGSVVAIGAPGQEGKTSRTGHVRIYKNENDAWTQVGGDIEGDAWAEYFGKSVSLSSDGSVVVIGSPGNDGNGTDSGLVRVYQNVNDSWTKVGGDIVGEASGDESGESVSISSDGSFVAIGATGNDGNRHKSGHVRVYQNVNNTWTQVDLIPIGL